MAFTNEFSQDAAFNQLLEQFSNIVIKEINPEFYITDNCSSHDLGSVQFRKSVNQSEDAWLTIGIIDKEQYKHYKLTEGEFDNSEEYCLLGNLRVMEDGDTLSNESYLFHFSDDAKLFELYNSFYDILYYFQGFINNLLEE